MLTTCSSCKGFVPPRIVSCPNCHAPMGGQVLGRMASLRRALASSVFQLVGAASMCVTLMACYGDTSYYDCYEQGDCQECSIDSECPAGYLCTDSDGMCDYAARCEEDSNCGPGRVCDDRNTCVPAPEPTCDAVGCDAGTECNLETLFCEPCPNYVCPEPTCEERLTETECLAGDCTAVYRGVDCHAPDGGECTSDSECSCDSFELDMCLPLPLPEEPPTEEEPPAPQP